MGWFPTTATKITLIAYAALFAAFPLGGSAHAASTARLVYVRNRGAESCPEEAAIRAAVAARLGYDPFFTTARATMFAEISRAGSAFTARIKLVDENNVVRGLRDLTSEGDRCADIVDTMALSMSIAIDPESLTGPKTPPIVEAVGPPSAAEGALTAEHRASSAESGIAPLPVSRETRDAGETHETRETRKTPPQVHLESGLGSAIWVGAAPSANIALSLFLRSRFRTFSIAIEGRIDLPASKELDVATVRTSLSLAAVVPCFHADPLAFCAVASGGVLRATSSEVASPRADSAWHAALGPRVLVEAIVFRSVSLWLGVDARMTLRSQTLQLNGADVYSLPRWSLGVGAGASFRFF
ncbi:MAG: hypothetical protein NVS3B20_20690 [Polyangiales bacterium]